MRNIHIVRILNKDPLIGTATVENSMEVPQKIKNRTTIWFSNFDPGYIAEETKTLIWKDICSPIFIATLFTVTKIQKQPNVHQQMNG